jgi:hypothetical protein
MAVIAAIHAISQPRSGLADESIKSLAGISPADAGRDFLLTRYTKGR